MKQLELNLFENSSEPLTFPEIQCKRVTKKINQAFKVFDSLDKSRQYSINFSGGKDSHALLICYLLWIRERKVKLDAIVQFSDTRLEEPELYQIITNIENCIQDKIRFKKVQSDYSYWYYQFAYGSPVPDHINRWCTKILKVTPMLKASRIPLTGRHFGESISRDNRLSCSQGECGTDLIKDSYDPIVYFDDCDVWDLIFYASGTILYESLFDDLKATYDGNTQEKGSLRMGCIMCPVVSINSILRKENQDFIRLRELLEELRRSQRIRTPRAIAIKSPKNKDRLLEGNEFKILKKDSFNRTVLRYVYSCLLVTLFLKTKIKYAFCYLKFNPLGAIHIKERRRIWQKIDKEYLIENNYLTKKELKLIDDMLKLESYPKTYSIKWIEKEYRRLDYLKTLKGN